MGYLDDFLSAPDQEPTHYDPVSLLWQALPQNVRDTYRSGGRAALEAFNTFSPGAIIRDTLKAGGDWTRSLLDAKSGANTDPWNIPTKTAGLLTAMAGVMPGAKVEGKIASEIAPEIKAAASEAAPAVARVAPTLEARAADAVRNVTKSTELPSLREMTVDEAVAHARHEPHLIRAGDQSEGMYVGGPREVTSKAGLNAMRRNLDRRLDEQHGLGGDWYDRYRAGLDEVTGGDPLRNLWSSAQQGQWSAGVAPRAEIAFTQRENAGALVGRPQRGFYGAQTRAQNRAMAMNDPSQFQLGDKTGQYARQINPNQPRPPAATGVNDFRWAREFGYTEKDGSPQSGALTDAQHRFMDYETALAVDRANQRQLAGRTDWSGEKIQAIPWVKQKAEDLFERSKGVYTADAEREIKQQLGADALKRNAPADVKTARQAIYDKHYARGLQEQTEEANKTIADFFPQHTAYAQHESRPGSVTEHLPGLLNATPEQLAAYHADPASSWASAPNKRDAIYGGLVAQSPAGTGVAMRVRPTNEMQGMWFNDATGKYEFNPGASARPLVGFNAGGVGDVKRMTPADRDILDAGEKLRAIIDAQAAGSAIKPWIGGPAMKSNSAWVPMSRKLTPDEMVRLREATQKHGLGDVIDTGEGFALTNFSKVDKMSVATQKNVEAEVLKALRSNEPVKFHRASLESVYADLSDKWAARDKGSPVTQSFLDSVNKTPELRAMFNKNPYLAERAHAKMVRDSGMEHGAARQSIQNFRKIVSEGTVPGEGGWIDRLEAAKKAGKIALPSLLAPVAGGALLSGRDDGPSS